LIFLFLIIFNTPIVNSAYGVLIQTFNNPTPGLDDFFALHVTNSGNYVLVGAHQDDTGAEDAGSAYLFDTSGKLLETYNNPTPEINDQFGISMDISENYVLVGAFGDNTGARTAGSAYLFDTSGKLLETFNNPTPERGDEFAFWLSISENNILVGAYRDNTGAKDAGSAYLFDTSGKLLETYNNPTPEINDQFGESVSIYGNHVLIGAHQDDTGAEDAGSVYLFDTSGKLLETYNNPTPAVGDLFGDAVSIYGNYVLIGANRDDTGAEDAGSVYLFDTSGKLLETYNNPTPEIRDRLGHSVDIYENYILAGAHREDTGAKDAGTAYLFDTSGKLLETFNNPIPEHEDRFAHSVSIYGNYILVSSDGDDTGAENAGSAYLFESEKILPVQTPELLLDNDEQEILPVKTPDLLLDNDEQEITVWLIPLVLAGGIGLVFLLRKKTKKFERKTKHQ